MADGPHRDPAPGDSGRFSRTPRERGSYEPYDAFEGDLVGPPSGRHHLLPPPAPRHPPPQAFRPSPSRPGPHIPPQAGHPYATGPQPVDRPHSAGPQPFSEPYSTGSRSFIEPYSTGSHPMDRRHTTGSQPIDRRHTGPQPLDRPHSTGPQPPNELHHTGRQSLVRPYATGPQPIDRPPSAEPHHTGPQAFDGPYSTGSHPTGGWHHTGPQPFGEPYPNGEPPGTAGRHHTGPQSFGGHHHTGPQPYSNGTPLEPGGGWPQTGPFGEPYPNGDQSTDEPYPNGHQPAFDGAPQPWLGQRPFGDGAQHMMPEDAGPFGELASGTRTLTTDEREHDIPAQRRALPASPAEEDDYPPTRLRAKKSRRNRRVVLATKGSAAAVAVAVVLATGFAWGNKKWSDDKFRQVAALDPGSAAIIDPAKQRGDHNFLLIGTDTRDGAEAEDPAGGARSDTVMVAHIPADRSRVVVVSFPRDLQVERPACEGWDPSAGRYTGERTAGDPAAKLNTAYAVGGPRCATRVVQQLTGLNVNHFVGIEFAGFKGMVDAVGGVRMCVERPIVDQYLGTVVEAPGEVTLTGDKALDLVRARHVDGDPTSDLGRVRRQQQLIAALVRTAMSDRVLFDRGRLGGLVDAMAANTITDNVGADELIELGTSLNGVDAGKVTFVTLPTTGGANGNEELRADEAKSLFRALIDDAPLPGAQPSPAAADPAGTGEPPTATVPPEQIKLQVLNGTGQDGLASSVARKLRDVGFEVVKVDNTQPAARTVIRFSATRELQARTASAALPGAVLLLDPSMGGAVELVLGGGFDGAVNGVQLGQPVPDQPIEQAQQQPSAVLDTISGADTACA